MITLSTAHDPTGLFLPLVRKAQKELAKYFPGAIVAHTKETTPKLTTLLKDLGWQPIVGGQWGEARKKALGQALKTKEQYFFLVDFDKILHWLAVAPEELKSILKLIPKKDCLLFGRSVATMATYPDSWIKTEGIINRLIGKVLGFQADPMAAILVFNRKAAEVIYKKAQEKSWGACSEWPLLVYQAGLKMGSQGAKGLSWEDPDWFRGEIKKMGSLKAWQEANYGSLKEWEKRASSVMEQLRVMRRLLKDVKMKPPPVTGGRSSLRL